MTARRETTTRAGKIVVDSACRLSREDYSDIS